LNKQRGGGVNSPPRGIKTCKTKHTPNGQVLCWRGRGGEGVHKGKWDEYEHERVVKEKYLGGGSVGSGERKPKKNLSGGRRSRAAGMKRGKTGKGRR